MTTAGTAGTAGAAAAPSRAASSRAARGRAPSARWLPRALTSAARRALWRASCAPSSDSCASSSSAAAAAARALDDLARAARPAGESRRPPWAARDTRAGCDGASAPPPPPLARACRAPPPAAWSGAPSAPSRARTRRAARPRRPRRPRAAPAARDHVDDDAVRAREPRVDDDRLAERGRVGAQVEDLGLQQQPLDEHVEALAGRAADRHERDVAAVLLRHDARVVELGLHAVPRVVDLHAVAVDLGQRDDEAHVARAPHELEHLARLRLHAAVGRDDEHDDVGRADAVRAHRREELVPRRVDERDRAREVRATAAVRLGVARGGGRVGRAAAEAAAAVGRAPRRRAARRRAPQTPRAAA